MIYALVFLNIFIAVALVVAILLQSGRGGGLASALGGGPASQVFGGRGASSFLVKLTTGLAIGFVVLTIMINILSSRPTVRPTSVISKEASKQQLPAQPTMPQSETPAQEEGK
jgi:preprotein translocase subunit SecG